MILEINFSVKVNGVSVSSIIADYLAGTFGGFKSSRIYNKIKSFFFHLVGGLPSCFNSDYWNSDILKLGLIWGVIDSMEGRKADKFLENYWSVLALRILQAAEKCNLNPYKYAI